MYFNIIHKDGREMRIVYEWKNSEMKVGKIRDTC